MNAELKVGAVEETITVTGESPIVDVQNAAQQRVLAAEVLDAIPTVRTQFTNAVLIPGMNISTAQDVGGTNSLAGTTTSLSIHGGRGGDQRVLIDGMPTANIEGTGNSSNFLPNMGSTQEMTVDYAAGTAEQETGGVRINMIPREGGNTFKGSFFATGVNSSFQADNYTPELGGRRPADARRDQAQLRLQPLGRRSDHEGQAVVLHLGAICRQRELRRRGRRQLNAGNPNAWTYVARSEPARRLFPHPGDASTCG